MSAAASEAEIGQRLKGILDYVRDCQSRVTRGEIMDLRGLDKNVIEICDDINRLDPKEGKKLEKPMGTLIKALEELAEAIRSQQKIREDVK